MRFRFHRGGLAESLATTIMVNTMAELVTALNKATFSLNPITFVDQIAFVPQPSRFNLVKRGNGRWETHMVTVNDMAVGYSDGEFAIDPRQVVQVRVEPVNRLAQKWNPSQFQAMDDGTKVSGLSHADTAQMLCIAMTVITRLESATVASTGIFEDWHNGKIEPDPSLNDRLRAMLNEVKDVMGSQVGSSGYFSRARDMVGCAINLIDAHENSPT